MKARGSFVFGLIRTLQIPMAPRAALAQVLGGALLLLAFASGPVRAGSDTWKASPASGDWHTAGNWVGGAVPNASPDTATFGTSLITALSLPANVEVNSIVFNSGASAYTFSVIIDTELTFSGTGITNNSGGAQNFVAASDQDYDLGFGTISFTNSATAAGNTTFTNQGSTYAYGDTNQYSWFGGGISQFFNTSQAGSATFTNNGGSEQSDAGGGGTIFHDSSSASSGTFTNKGGQEVAAYGGVTVFNDASNAGTAHFTNEDGPGVATRGGYTIFNDTSDARDGAFTSHGGLASGTMGVTMFNHSANAGSADFITNGGTASGGSGGYVIFNDTASAATGNFTTNGGAVDGAGGGNVQFWAGTTAGNGTFTTNGGAVSGASGGFVYFTNYLADYGSTFTPATAGNGTFTTNGGAVSGASGGYIAFEDATADHGTFTTNGGTASGAGGGYIALYDGSTADHGTFILNGGTASGIDGAAAGGRISFNQTSTAANSTLIANGGTNGGGGGSIQFHDAALGGNAVVKVYGNGNLDIRPHGAPGVTIGSLEGSGEVFLGARTLTVGSNHNSTQFSGVIQDGGLAGSFEKIGAGTLELSGASTYTGTTFVSTGTVLINNSSGSVFGGSAVTVSPGATLAGGGSFTGDLQLDGILSPGNSPGTLSAGTTTFGGGGSFIWEINSAHGTAGQETGWDLLNISGTLDIAASPDNRFTIFITSLTPGNSAGVVFDFNPNTDYSYAIASTWGIENFDADAFDLNLTGFANSYTGTWAVESNGFDLALVYNGSAVPEPSTYAACAGLGALGFVIWRRRKAAVVHPVA